MFQHVSLHIRTHQRTGKGLGRAPGTLVRPHNSSACASHSGTPIEFQNSSSFASLHIWVRVNTVEPRLPTGCCATHSSGQPCQGPLIVLPPLAFHYRRGEGAVPVWTSSAGKNAKRPLPIGLHGDGIEYHRCHEQLNAS